MKKISKIIGVSIITNFLLSCIKFIFGVISRSNALIADGLHSFSDLATDAVAFFGSKVASKPADDKHPFGHGKAEYLTSLVIGVVVSSVGISLIINSFGNKNYEVSLYVLFVSLFTIIVKYILSSYLLICGKKYNNQILTSSGRESSADVVSSLFVLISSVLMQLSSVVPIFKYADMIASIIVGLFIVKTGVGLVKDNVSVILGEQDTNEENLSKIKEVIFSYKEIIGIDKLIVLKFGHICSITCEVTMDGSMTLQDSHDVIDEIEFKIKEIDDRYQHINIHINPK